MIQNFWRTIFFLAGVGAVLAPGEPAHAQDAALSATADEGPQLPYRGSLVIYEHATRPWAYTGEELTYNPYYVHSLSLRPRWYFNDHIWARVMVDMEQELTNADDSTLRNEFRITGTTLDANYSGIELFPNATLDTRLTLGFPTDQISQIRTMYLSVGPSFAFNYAIPQVAKGLTLTFGMGLTKYLNRYADGDTDVLQYCGGGRNSSVECSSTGSMNPNFRLLPNLVAALQVTEQLSFTADFRIYANWAYATPDTTASTLSGEVEVERSADDTRLRALNRFILDVSYNVTKYFGVSIGTDTYVPQVADDGSYRNPFFNRFTNFYLDLTLTPDELVKALNPGAAATARNRQEMGGDDHTTRTAANEAAPRE